MQWQLSIIKAVLYYVLRGLPSKYNKIEAPVTTRTENATFVQLQVLLLLKNYRFIAMINLPISLNLAVHYTQKNPSSNYSYNCNHGKMEVERTEINHGMFAGVLTLTHYLIVSFLTLPCPLLLYVNSRHRKETIRGKHKEFRQNFQE